MKKIDIAMPATGEEEWQAVKDPLMSGWLTQGPKVAEFEQAFAVRHNAKHALACSSCTTALHLILVAMGVGSGDEVIVPAFTWVATANVVVYCGATPVFVDVDKTTYNMDSAQISRKVTDRTKAIIAVHMFGLCADIDSITNAAPGVPIIEDAACAVGASYKGRSAGALGVAAAFSFHPRKLITTGEGGMVTCRDDSLAKKISILRSHGASVSEEQRHHGPKPFLLPEFNLLGFNYRMTDLQGAVGLVQLGKLNKLINERKEIAEYYCRELRDNEWLSIPEFTNGCGWQAFVCRVDEGKAPMGRNEIMAALQAKGVSTRPGTHAVHMLGYYRDEFLILETDFPVARDSAQFTMAIPLHNRMSIDDCEYVVRAIKSL